jgi:hypothetical protein
MSVLLGRGLRMRCHPSASSRRLYSATTDDTVIQAMTEPFGGGSEEEERKLLVRAPATADAGEG